MQDIIQIKKLLGILQSKFYKVANHGGFEQLILLTEEIVCNELTTKIPIGLSQSLILAVEYRLTNSVNLDSTIVSLANTLIADVKHRTEEKK